MMDCLNVCRHGEKHFEKSILESMFSLSPLVPSSTNKLLTEDQTP